MNNEFERTAPDAPSSVESTPAGETPTPPARRPELQRRLDRVAAYGAAALAKRSLFLSVLGSANSGLMSISLLMEESLLQALAGAPLPIEQLEKLQPALDMYLRLMRQSDRFLQVEKKSKPRRSAPANSAHGKTDRNTDVGNA